MVSTLRELEGTYIVRIPHPIAINVYRIQLCRIQYCLVLYRLVIVSDEGRRRKDLQ